MNDNEISLNITEIGDRVTVKALRAEGAMKRRLQDLGVIEGTKIKCVLKSPSGDPCAYLIRGAVIALRNEVSSEILVNKICN